jgi:hypothetical protein
VLGLLNEERVKAELNELVLDTNPIEHRYAESMLETGEFKHNPELPGIMARTSSIIRRTRGSRSRMRSS